jgi:light-regulated signal transduction histidine kinase (bacteriophytochrome)
MTPHYKTLSPKLTEFEQFAHIVSHDLKSPLRNIGSYAQLLKRRYEHSLDADANVFLDYIVKNAEVMTEFLTDMLELSAIAHHTVRQPLDFNKIVEKIRIDLKSDIITNEAEIEVAELPTLAVYANIQQLLHNLIDNGLKYRNGQVPRIKIAAQLIENQDTWQISVTDNGVGLDEMYHEKVFLPFQRIDHRDRPGSGMGLAICRKVVHLHGGRIWYNRNTEGGTTFHFTIPQ